MKVSVIIPAHNEEKHIAKTLKAVCALDYPNFEVIVIDNA
ncbi:MAG: glycosyltransferase, partial [Candidatus Paceibacterota bacterium]